MDEDDDEITFMNRFERTPALPTPLALQNISKRAQESLAQLYNDNMNEDEDLTNNFQPKILNFNDDDSD